MLLCFIRLWHFPPTDPLLPRVFQIFHPNHSAAPATATTSVLLACLNLIKKTNKSKKKLQDNFLLKYTDIEKGINIYRLQLF